MLRKRTRSALLHTTAPAATLHSMRHFFSGVTKERAQMIRNAGMQRNKMRGRDPTSDAFLKQIELVCAYDPSDIYKDVEKKEGIVVAEPLMMEEASSRTRFFPCLDPRVQRSHSALLPGDIKPNMRRNADAVLFRIPKDPNWELPFNSSRRAKEQFERENCSGFSIFFIDPDISDDTFNLQTEAQVEMVTCFRNIFACIETIAQLGFPVNQLRVPALSIASVRYELRSGISKMNHQAILQGFHRIPETHKDFVMTTKDFRCQLYVPAEHFPPFKRVFLEEPWEIPMKTFDLFDRTLYPNLRPPPALAESPDWVGKRPELEAIVDDGGKMLLEAERGIVVMDPAKEAFFDRDGAQQRWSETGAAEMEEFAKEKGVNLYSDISEEVDLRREEKFQDSSSKM